MKLIVLKLSIVSVLCFFWLSVYTSALDVVKNAVATIETQEQVAESTLYTLIAANDIANTLKEQCDPEVIQEAQKFSSAVRNVLRQRYDTRNDAQVLVESSRLFTLLQESQKKADAYSDALFCGIKYVLYDTQNRLREYHMKVLERNGLTGDFGPFSTETLYGLDVKLTVLDDKINYYEQFIEKLGITLTVDVENESFMDTLSNDQQDLMSRIQRLMELMVYATLYDLQQKGILTDLDIQQLKNATVLELVKWCSSFHGNYAIKETLDHQGNHISYQTTALHLKVNYCPNFFVLKELDFLMRKIITHELGHHVYYYTDTNPQNFENICRSDGDTRKQACTAKDFVSQYAQTLAVEDYADHFMHRTLGIIPQETEIIRKKSEHFEKLFE